MPALLVLGKVIVATLAVGAVGLTAALVVPAPTDLDRMWFDQPLSGSVIVEGPTTVRLHLPEDATVVSIQVIRDGIVAGAVIDSDLDYVPEGKDRRAPYLAEGTFTFSPGVYQLKPNTTGPAAEGYAITITVIAAGEPAGDAPAPLPTGTATPTPTPTPRPVQSFGPTPGPTRPPLAPPQPLPTVPPAPQPTTPPVSYEMPYGFVRQTITATTSDWQSFNFTIKGGTPQTAIGSVQYQVVAYQTAPIEGNWSSLPCTTNLQPDPSGYSFTTTPGQVHLDGVATGYYRVVLTNGDKTYIGPNSYWTVPMHTAR